MIKCILTVGGIACGKSTWAREEVRKDPEGTARINRDDLRNMVNGYVFSDSNERLITKIRAFIKSFSFLCKYSPISGIALNPKNENKITPKGKNKLLKSIP